MFTGLFMVSVLLSLQLLQSKEQLSVSNDINQELVDKGLAAYTEKGIKARGYVCDVTDEPAVQAMVAQIEKEVGSVDPGHDCRHHPPCSYARDGGC